MDMTQTTTMKRGNVDMDVLGGRSLLMSLPPELFKLTSQLLSKSDLQSLRGCSSYINERITPILYHTPSIPQYPIHPIEPILSRYGHHIRHLRFPDPTDINLIPVAPSITGLLSIDFSGITAFRIKDAEIIAILLNSPRLVSIIMSDCVEITNASLLHLAKHPNITIIHTLRIDRCCELTDTSLIPVLKLAKNLKVFSMSLVPLATDAVLGVLAASCPLLEDLGMSDNDCVTDDALTALALSCPRLRAVNLSECREVTEAGLLRFAQIKNTMVHAPISSLVLNGVTVATAKTVASLFPLQQPVKTLFGQYCGLTRLELSEIGTLSPQLFNHLASLSTKSLSILNLNQSHFDFVQQPIPQPELLSSFSAFLASQPLLHTLTLSGGLSNLINDTICAIIAQALPTLTTLDLSDCTLLTDTGIQSIASSCFLLEDLNLKGCTAITDTSVHSLLSNRDITTIKLKSLNVGLCSKITNASAKSLARLCIARPSSTGMHTLKFSGCINISDDAITSLQNSLSSHPSSLHLLCLSGCYRVSGQSLRFLLPHLPSLESINIFSCPSFNDAALTTLAKSCPHLQSLVIAKCPIGDPGALAISLHAKKLHTLYMGFLAPTSTPLTNVGVSALLRQCLDLKLLDVSRCDALTDEAFEGLEKMCLQVMVAKVCPRVTVKGLSRLVGGCPRLQSLEVVGCVRVSAADRERLRELMG